MREDGMHKLLFRGFEVHGDHVTLDQLGYFRADHVGTEQRPARFVEDHLDQPLVLTERDGLAVSHKRKPADPDLALLLLCALLREADRGDLRGAVGAARDEPLVHRVWVQALDRLDTNDPFMLGLMREQRRPGDVADGIDTRNVGTVERIDNDRPAVGLYAKFLQAEILDIPGNANRRNGPLEFERLNPAFSNIDGGANALPSPVEPGHLGVSEDPDALLLELLAGKA